MMASQSPKAMIKRLIPVGLLSASALLATFVHVPAAQAVYFPRKAGSYECKNSLDPQCKNPSRNFTAQSWVCQNNPGPKCAKPPRVSMELNRGNRQCAFNQNVVACRNDIRFSVPNPSEWPSYFQTSTSSSSSTTTTP